ncbi:hypothetical protein F4813DRAFT_185914 [Daldinia decipiens]|uniref:uncharacterized protein n=1 Tax=Daldinia decipiens TaxID=326647 RepID=UPI0020C526EE|nr:uncharacterized protein F4813DRAFT_185914 [Daldinia decipiens]KAI1655253.1 hypothetical protein F4813DRAFT_185914 [Daldinia decipiens]
MRIDASRFGILASLIGLVGAEDHASRTTDGAMPAPTGGTGTATMGSSPNSVIQVQNLPTPAIYKPQATDQIIYFSKGQGISELNISAIYLKRFKDKITVAMGKMSGTSQTGITAGSFLDGQLVAERQDQFPPSFFPATNESLTLMLTGDLTITYGDNLMQPLYYEIQWENTTSSGSSYSPVLAVTYSEGYSEASRLIKNTGKESSPAFQEDIEGSSSNPESSGASTVTATPAAETSIQQASEVSPGHRGLSTGAIIGIAVGCAVAVIIIVVALVWFFCLRRRNSSERVGGTDCTEASGSHAMIADKGAINVSESSPRSAFPADHSGRLHDQRDSIVRPDDASYAPYSDRASSPPLPPGAAFATNSQSDLASAGRPSTTTPPFQTRYAHLIEEGMTEEEIRRLEEEERHLDAAIEDAGRNSRAAHQP